MSAFTPTSFSIEPPDRPDNLSGAVLQSLSRPTGGKRKPWGVLKTLLLGGLTFGVAPLIFWPKTFRRTATVEQQQLWHLGEWLRLRTGKPAATALRDSTAAMRFRPGLWATSMLLLAWVVVTFVMSIHPGERVVPALIGMTYQYRRGHFIWAQSAETTRRVFVTWTGALSIAYLMQWLQVQVHAVELRRFVLRFNLIAAEEGLSPISPPVLGLGLYPLWLIGAIVMVWCNAVWGIPMMLAGAVQKMYTEYTSPATRSQLAYRVRAMLQTERPPMNVPLPMRLRSACGNPQCKCVLPKDASFCPRCGTRVEQASVLATA
jgi:hypothetical protein